MKKIKISLEHAGLHDLVGLLLKKDNMSSQENLNKHIEKIINLIDFYEKAQKRHDTKKIFLENSPVYYHKDGENVTFENDFIYYKKDSKKEMLTLNSFFIDSNQSFILYIKEADNFFRVKYIDTSNIYFGNIDPILSVVKNNRDILSIQTSSQKNNFFVSKSSEKVGKLNYKEFRTNLFSNINNILINNENVYELKVKNHLIESIKIKNNKLYSFTIKPIIKKHLKDNGVSIPFDLFESEKDFDFLKNKIDELNDFNKIIKDSDKIKLKNNFSLAELISESLIIIEKNKELPPIPEQLKKQFDYLTRDFNEKITNHDDSIVYTLINEKELKNIKIEDMDSLYNDLSSFIKETKPVKNNKITNKN